MDPEHHWTVIVDGVAAGAPDADAAADVLAAALRRQPGRRTIRWRVESGGKTVLFGAVSPGNEDDGWYSFWAEGIRQQLNSIAGGAP